MRKRKRNLQESLNKIYEDDDLSRNITYESGDPLQYKEDFLKLWLVHMETINSVRTFPTIECNSKIFNESLNKFISKHKHVKFFAAKEDDDIVGFLQAGIAPNNTYGFISDLHVLETHRRHGIGKNLLSICLEWFKMNKVSEIDLDVSGGNEEALKFYKRNGFDIDMYSLKLKR